MEYYEGASYKINIEGYDSTLILDGYTRTLKATVIDQNDNIMVDHETGTLYGTLVGNIVDTDNNLIFDSERRIIHAEQFKGSIVDKHGDIVFDHNQTTFSGTFVGDLHGNIMSGETVIYDCETQSINANIIGNLFSADGGLSYDHDRNIFQGTFVGNFLDQDGNLLFSSSDTTQNFGDNVLMYSDGTIALDLHTKIITGSLWGNVVTQEGNVLLNAESEGFYGNVHGHVFSRDGAILLDVDTKTITGNLIGDIYNADGFLIFDHETFELRSNVMGNILASDGSIMVDTQTGVIVGTVVGNVSGNIVNSDMMTVFDSDNVTFAFPIRADIIGSVTGNIYDIDGDKILDADERTLQINSIISNSISSNFFGTFIGNIIDTDGLVVYNADSNEFLGTVTGQLEGNIFNSSGQIVYNFEAKEFNLDTVKIVDQLLSIDYENNLLSIGKASSSVPYSGGTIGIFTNNDISDDYSGLSLSAYKTSDNLAGMTLTRGRGSISLPQAVQPGDPLNCILFGGVSEVNGETTTNSPGAFISTSVSNNGTVNNTRINANLKFGVFDDNGEPIDALTIDKDGNTTIKNLTVVGETGNAPSNANTPTKWLEISVNGETVFMPLYS